jgi:hypothetical protein
MIRKTFAFLQTVFISKAQFSASYGIPLFGFSTGNI